MKYTYVLFDMDGTVLNTLDDLTDSVNHSLSLHGMPEVSSADVAHFLGNGARHLIECCVPEDTAPAETEKVLADYLPYYKAHCRIKTAPYPGIPELMRRLKDHGIKIAIVSNKPDAATKELSELFFKGLIEVTIGEAPGIMRKPAPDTVLEALRLLHADRSECVYIGDTEVDIQTAKNAGMDCISVLWGFRNKQELLASGAGILVETPEALEKILLRT